MRWPDLDHMIITDSLIITQEWEYRGLDYMNVKIILNMFTAYGVSLITTVSCRFIMTMANMVTSLPCHGGSQYIQDCEKQSWTRKVAMVV